MPDNADRKKISNTIDLLRKQVGDLYTSTYYTPNNSEELKTQASNKLDDAIRRSTQNDDEFNNISNTSKLFRKLLKPDKSNVGNKLNSEFGTGSENDISTMFQNPELMASLMDTYSKTKWISELDNEFDVICKYMPKLQTALDIKRDAVLCSDSYTKDFITVRAKDENPGSDRNAVIQSNIEEMIDRYDLRSKAEQWYERASKYGEEFVYCVPYNVALEELLKKKKNTQSTTISESFSFKDIIPKNSFGTASVIMSENGPAININFDKSKIIPDVIENNYYLRKAAGDEMLKGLSESFVITEANEKFEDHLKKSGKDTKLVFDKTVDGELEWEDDKTAANGLLTTNNKKDTKLKVNGAIVKSIKHDMFIPIYIEDTMFGGYHIRNRQVEDIDINSAGNVKGYNSITGMFNNGSVTANVPATEEEVNKSDMMLRSIAAQISKKIDAAFINSNTDLKKEIYLMLKFNDKYNKITDASMNLDIVFIPADDIHHLKFREDPLTHRGISDLWDSLVPAKQWITLTLTSVLGWTTRGFDRRVYYVKQSLDTNTAQSLLNVISTIKKGNFGVRQMESINNILNIVGRFNDFVIPMGPSGDAPIQFDTMPGQQFENPTELLNEREESAINATGVPIEIVNSSTGMDFAVRYTMTNARLLRDVLKRQLKEEDFLSEVFTKIYKFEYNEDVQLEVTLPPPAFLSMTQGTQLLNSAVQYADAIVEVEEAGQDDTVKQAFKKRLIRKLIPAYLTDDEIQEIKNNIVLDNSIQNSKNAANEEDYSDNG